MANNPLRQIKPGSVTLQTFEPNKVGTDPVAWLIRQAKPGMFLLAHADDGIIWGKVTEHEQAVQLVFPSTKLLPQASLRTATLLTARLFDAQQELFLWRLNENEWRARLLQDGTGDPCEYYDERQILWGDHATAPTDGFVKMTEGAQGFYHAPPAELLQEATKNGQHPVHLSVRHYLVSDEGWLRVGYSRLVQPETKEGAE